MKLREAAKRILKENMGLKKGEKLLVITDANKTEIGKAFLEEGRKIAAEARLLEIPVSERHGAEPPAECAEAMPEYDVIVIPITQSLSWTVAREKATQAGARIASMPSITEEIMMRSINADYDAMKERTMKLIDVLEKGKEARVTTEKGTDIRLGIEGAEVLGGDCGIYHKPGSWGNLPTGEAFLAPVEGTANGVFVVDAAMGGVGKVDEIRIEVKDGIAVSIEGKDAEKLKKNLEAVANKDAYNIAELGIGTNDKAKITGVVLEDEKVLGTAHIALGTNRMMGGTVEAGIHVDGIFLEPTIFVDGKKIIDKGKLLI